MTIQEIKETLDNISFAPSNLDMGWTFDIKPSKIYDNDSTVLEKGFVIRTTFMRPDILTGDMDKGYGRWMYIPENISKDGLVKTAWVCAELIVKHELMEAFLYENKRIFDPHKSLKDLQVNEMRVEGNTTKKDINSDENEKEKVKGSDEIFHQQNSANHLQEVKHYLNTSCKKVKIKNDNVERYTSTGYYIDLHIKENMLTIAKSSGEIIEVLMKDKYTLSSLKELFEKHSIVDSTTIVDPGLVNELIIKSGYTDASKHDEELNVWKYVNPIDSSKYVMHSETNKFISLANNKHDIILMFENDDYTYDNIKKLLKI